MRVTVPATTSFYSNGLSHGFVVSKAVLLQHDRRGIDIGFFFTFTQLLSLMAKAAGYTHFGLPHLCASRNVSLQALRDNGDPTCPWTVPLL